MYNKKQNYIYARDNLMFHVNRFHLKITQLVLRRTFEMLLKEGLHFRHTSSKRSVLNHVRIRRISFARHANNSHRDN